MPTLNKTCSFSGCGGSAIARGLCNGHWRQQWRGEPLRPIIRHASVEDRFWSKVQKAGPDDCWVWTARAIGGRGIFSIDSRYEYAPRVAWRITHGESPGALRVLHKCDNPACVNPAHLFLGTQAENIEDMVTKGRQYHPRGEANARAKLSEVDVREIRERLAKGESHRIIAAGYGVSKTAIGLIARGKNWKTDEFPAVKP